MKKSKYLNLMTLAILALLLTSLSLAYWAGDVAGSDVNKSNSITLGKAGEATTIVNLGEQKGELKNLVPKERKISEDQTESIELRFPVKWDSKFTKAASGTAGTLTVSNTNTFTNATDNNDIDVLSLYNVTFDKESYDIVADNDVAVEVIVTITLTEPANKEVYEALIKKAVTSNLTFKVTPK